MNAEELARDNADLHRRVLEIEERDRQRLSRIASLKVEVQQLKEALEVAARIAAQSSQEMMRAQGRAEQAEADAEDAEDKYAELVLKIGGAL